jgi:outer membrane autotransporter protein
MASQKQYPRQKVLVLALGAAIASMVSLSAVASCAVTSIDLGGNWGWTAGDCSITSGQNIYNNAVSGLVASGSVGALTNDGTIGGYTFGIYNSGTIASITNNDGGSIFAYSAYPGSAALYNTSGGSILSLTNNAGGTISSGSTGIRNSGSIGTLSNSGMISGGGGIGYAFFAGIVNTGSIGILNNNNGGVIQGNNTGILNHGGSIGTLTNSGVISGNVFGIDNTIGSIGTLTNNNGGSITSGTNVGAGVGIANSGTIGTLTNTGWIYGGSIGLDNSGTISALNNNASLTGGDTGIVNSGTIGSLTNSGVIDSTLKTAINNSSIGSIGVLTNTSSGTIVGSVGIDNAGVIGSVANAGTIAGASAILNAATGTLGTVTNSGVIAGNIVNLSSQDLVIDGGAGSIFGTLTGSTNSDGLYNSGALNIGTITSTLSNVTLGSGNLLLNDNINVGSNIVNNTGASLQVNNTINITGNYNQSAGASLLIGVANNAVATGSSSTDSGYGRLVVSGDATIAAGSSVNLKALNTYAFAVGQRFVVVEAAGSGTNYNQASLNYTASGFTGSITGTSVTDGSNQDLVLTLAAAPTPPSTPTPPTSPATIPNAISSLGGLANYTGVNPALLNLFDAANALGATGSTAALNKAGTQLCPTQQANSSAAAAAPTLDVLNVVAAHANSLQLAQADGGSASGISTGESTPGWAVWGQAFGGHASQNERDDVPGYNANYGGLLLGLDKAISENWRVGGVFTYSNTLINDTDNAEGDSTRVNAYGLIGYASYAGKPWYVNLSGGVVQQRYDTSRLIDFPGFSGNATGQFGGQQYVARVEGGYPLALGSMTFTPLASLTYTDLHQQGYTESGGNGAALSVDATHTASVKSGLGFKLEQGFSTRYGDVVPDLQLQWIHEYDHTRQVTGAGFAVDPSQTAFTSVGAAPVSDVAGVSVGVSLLRASNLSLSLRYELQAGGGFVSQTGSLRLRQLF